MKKVCSKCKVEKEVSSFHKQKGGKFGVRKICKECRENLDMEELEKRREGQKRSIERRYGNPVFRLRRNMHSRVCDSLKSKNIKKTKPLIISMGVDFDELKVILEKQFTDGMSWENYGPYWHVDHKIPLSTAHSIEEFETLLHYTNLQPLTCIENYKKHNL